MQSFTYCQEIDWERFVHDGLAATDTADSYLSVYSDWYSVDDAAKILHPEVNADPRTLQPPPDLEPELLPSEIGQPKNASYDAMKCQEEANPPSYMLVRPSSRYEPSETA